MVMVEGVANSFDPDINMWETAGPFIKEWIRSELGPETALADSLIENWRALQRFPGLIRRLEARYPPEGGAPPLLPLPDIQLIRIGGGWKYGVVALGAAFVAAAGLWLALVWRLQSSFTENKGRADKKHLKPQLTERRE